MRGRLGIFGDRAIGIALGIVLGIAIVLLFLFLESRNTIDEPEVNGGGGAKQTLSQPATTTQPRQPQ
jgi:hypothetical protein